MRSIHTKGFIFDFDGVILDSASIKTDAFLELFKKHPEHLAAIKAYHIKHQGITRYQKFNWIYQELLDQQYSKKTEAKLSNSFSEIVLRKMKQTNTIAGAIELLRYLKKNEIPSFIASGTPDEELNNIVIERNLSSYFRSVFGSNLKKEQVIDLVMKNYGLINSELIFVGDSITDYEAANSRDVPFVAVYSDTMEDFWKEKQITPIHNLMEIIELIEIEKIV